MRDGDATTIPFSNLCNVSIYQFSVAQVDLRFVLFRIATDDPDFVIRHRENFTRSAVKRAQGNISFGRFGAGIYTSSTSSKSDDYSSNGSTRNSKAMFLSYVVVGKGHKLTKDQTNLTSAPAGYDSVLGEVGQNLNYDECIVYRDDAIRPAYLVIYA
ncbi:hypothetical protein E4T56_gene2590 [Termitomyces sp. T112]|nr:hypothetical protein E4T56_gene2590 [Termitomyces sp. T112]